MENNVKNEFITIKDAASILKVTKLTLRNWDKTGKLKAYRHPFNNYRLYKVADIDNVIEMMNNDISIIQSTKDEVRKLNVIHLPS
ncbi:MAG: MerR family DNA-binding transcriptional regulator [Patescibacteria group bacterium]